MFLDAVWEHFESILKAFWGHVESILRAPSQYWKMTHDISQQFHVFRSSSASSPTPFAPAAHTETLGSYLAQVFQCHWFWIPHIHKNTLDLPFFSSPSGNMILPPLHHRSLHKIAMRRFLVEFVWNKCGVWLCTKKKQISIAHHSFPLGSLIMDLRLQQQLLQGTPLWRFLVYFFWKRARWVWLCTK